MSEHNNTDRPEYLEKKRALTSIFTIYGRKPVAEALADSSLNASRLHLADSNKGGGTMDEILALAKARAVECVYHSRQALARISKNGKQDQGVALDIQLPGFRDYRAFLDEQLKREHTPLTGNFIALDKITNPQNLGMIIRTVCASPLRALLIPRKGCAKIDALVIKASVGTLFKANILWCDDLADALKDFKQAGADILGLSGKAKTPLWQLEQKPCKVFVLGNETQGVSKEVAACCTRQVVIPMHNGVESLNVAVSAGIIAFNFQAPKEQQ